VHLIQILLPARGRNGDVRDNAFARTREELVEAFQGVTAYTRTPAQGVWVDPEGDREHDDVVMVEVLTEKFDRAWWKAFGERLAERFDQEEIHIRALPAETP
jgi:vacuolar-type H+-ATPase subunit C/Vma6